MATALGVSANQAGEGLSPLAHRHVIGAQWTNTGIVAGLGTKTRTDLRYAVDAGVAVCQRAGSDGKMLAYYPGGTTDAVAAGGTQPRIDAIWILAHNQVEYNDTDNDVVIGVTQGTPAATPATPTVPEGATVLRYYQVPASASNTNACTPTGAVTYAVPFGANLGCLGTVQERRDFEIANTASSKWNGLKLQVNLPTDRMIRIVLDINYNAKGSNPTSNASVFSELTCQVRIDGNGKGTAVTFVGRSSWESHQYILSTICGSGVHTIDLVAWIGYGVPASIHYNNGARVGMQIQVFDDGPQQ